MISIITLFLMFTMMCSSDTLHEQLAVRAASIAKAKQSSAIDIAIGDRRIREGSFLCCEDSESVFTRVWSHQMVDVRLSLTNKGYDHAIEAFFEKRRHALALRKATLENDKSQKTKIKFSDSDVITVP